MDDLVSEEWSHAFVAGLSWLPYPHLYLQIILLSSAYPGRKWLLIMNINKGQMPKANIKNASQQILEELAGKKKDKECTWAMQVSNSQILPSLINTIFMELIWGA